VLGELAERGLLGGYKLGDDYPELNNALLVCATETKNAADIELFAKHLRDILKTQ